jgi:tetratricopeptide (TPR) repeat protein
LVRAQNSEAQQVRIELKIDGEPILLGYMCELDEFRTHQRFGVADLHADGIFTFRNVPYGDYSLSILDAFNQTIHQELITVGQSHDIFTVQFAKRNESRPPSGPVSVNELRHPPARKAFSAMVAAQRYSEAGDYRRAAGELEKAVRISPDYADAYQNLAVQYIRLGQFERAVDEIRRATQFAKPGPVQLCNLAFAQAQLKHYDEAIDAARASLRLDANYVQAHYLLGALLAQNGRTLPEARLHLERAARSMPAAEGLLQQVRKLAP